MYRRIFLLFFCAVAHISGDHMLNDALAPRMSAWDTNSKQVYKIFYFVSYIFFIYVMFLQHIRKGL